MYFQPLVLLLMVAGSYCGILPMPMPVAPHMPIYPMKSMVGMNMFYPKLGMRYGGGYGTGHGGGYGTAHGGGYGAGHGGGYGTGHGEGYGTGHGSGYGGGYETGHGNGMYGGTGMPGRGMYGWGQGGSMHNFYPMGGYQYNQIGYDPNWRTYTQGGGQFGEFSDPIWNQSQYPWNTLAFSNNWGNQGTNWNTGSGWNGGQDGVWNQQEHWGGSMNTGGGWSPPANAAADIGIQSH